MKRFCDRCGSDYVHKHSTKVTLARGQSQRYQCQKCARIFHDPLSTLPILEVEGYWDIETSQAGRGAGNFGIMYSWAIKNRKTGRVHGDHMKERTRAEEKRILSSMLADFKRYDRLYTWYGTRHDVTISRSRSECYGLDFPSYQTLHHTDLYFSWRSKFALHSNRQDSVAEFLGQPPQEHSLRPSVWVDALFNDTFKKAIKFIYKHNVEDTHQTHFIHERMEKYMMGVKRSI